MKYIVMECHNSYAVLLDEEGRFVKAASLHYEVGQTVENPILMHDAPVFSEPRRQQKLFRILTGTAAALAACLVLVFGLHFYQGHMTVYSSILLSINPAVRMDLNREGEVIELAGANEDGVLLLEGYDGEGKSRLTVTEELIGRAIDMGFLSEGGRISFSIDTPDEVLFQEYGLELREGVTAYLAERFTVTIEITAGTGESAAEPSAEDPAETEAQPQETFSPASSAAPETTAPAATQPPAETQAPTAPPQTQAPTAPPATQAPTVPSPPPATQAPTAPATAPAGDSGYGDSGYEPPDSDSSYEEQPEGDSAYAPEDSGDSAYEDDDD